VHLLALCCLILLSAGERYLTAALFGYQAVSASIQGAASAKEGRQRQAAGWSYSRDVVSRLPRRPACCSLGCCFSAALEISRGGERHALPGLPCLTAPATATAGAAAAYPAGASAEDTVEAAARYGTSLYDCLGEQRKLVR